MTHVLLFFTILTGHRGGAVGAVQQEREVGQSMYIFCYLHFDPST